MTVWEIILIILAILNLISIVISVLSTFFEWQDNHRFQWYVLLIGVFIYPVLLFIAIGLFLNNLYNIYEDGGFKEHRKRLKREEEELKQGRLKYEAGQAEYAKEREEWDRIKASYLKGEIKRTELPRVENGIDSFEFSPDMILSVDYDSDVREIIYVESEYNERLNRFFVEHKDLRLYHMYKFVYLPALHEELIGGDVLHYLYPDANPGAKLPISLTSNYPMQYLVYPEDRDNIKQGMFFFRDGRDNHGAEYIEGDYHPLYEGTDEEIIAQLDAIVKKVHSKHCHTALYCKEERLKSKEGSKNYADDQFSWELYDDDVAIIIDEVRERFKKLKEKGLTEKILFRILKEKPKLSRLVVTKDMRIILPDYNTLEIKMEPINKAVYLLFLRHPEGIIFKHLPDYRKELVEIYQKIKPFGLNDRALQSIEDVTTPCLNSINEKCARIRGAFISLFDESLAKNYYIYGLRGEPKKISLPQDLVIWE